MTTLPALSTPCTWNTFLARSTPMVLTCMWTTPSGDALFNDHPFGTIDAGAGVVHHINRVICLKGTHNRSCTAINRSLFDHLVGAREQRRWHGEAEGFRSLEVDHHLRLGRLLHWHPSR